MHIPNERPTTGQLRLGSSTSRVIGALGIQPTAEPIQPTPPRTPPAQANTTPPASPAPQNDGYNPGTAPRTTYLI